MPNTFAQITRIAELATLLLMLSALPVAAISILVPHVV